MPEVARLVGTTVEVIDSGGQRTMGRPDDAGQQTRGPLAASLVDRLDGSSSEVSGAIREIEGGGALAIREAGNRETAAIPSVLLERTGQDGALPVQDPSVLAGRVSGGAA